VTIEDAVADPESYGLTADEVDAARRWWACDPS